MYTQCPECSTVFRITADALRTAQGMVRCGICSASFNALDYLNEQPLARLGTEPAEDDTITVEELPGTEFIELSVPVENAPEGAEADDASAGDDGPADDDREGEAPPGPADAGDEIPDAALEFRGSPEDLERLFVAAMPPVVKQDAGSPEPPEGDVGDRDDLEQAIGEIAGGDFSGIEVEESAVIFVDADGVATTSADPGRIAEVLAFPREAMARAEPDSDKAAGTVADEPPVGDLDRTDEYPVLVPDGAGKPVSAGADEAAEAITPEPATHDAAPETETEAAREESGKADEEAPSPPQDTTADTEAEEDDKQDAAPVLLIPEELRRGSPPPGMDDFADIGTAAQGAVTLRWPYVAGIAVLLLLLAGQAVHHWRSELVQNPVVGPWLLASYSALGLPLAAPVDLSRFEIRQLGTASEPGQSGRLKLRASLVNRASFAQPFPLLRLTLQDRFGSTIATRDLTPGEYLPGGARAAAGLLGPSQRADAEVVFVDPGRDAVGFELDVCARTASGVHCSADQAPGHS